VFAVWVGDKDAAAGRDILPNAVFQGFRLPAAGSANEVRVLQPRTLAKQDRHRVFVAAKHDRPAVDGRAGWSPSRGGSRIDLGANSLPARARPPRHRAPLARRCRCDSMRLDRLPGDAESPAICRGSRTIREAL
jgi:hypothetical protein